jgi:hypothetical protein
MLDSRRIEPSRGHLSQETELRRSQSCRVMLHRGHNLRCWSTSSLGVTGPPGIVLGSQFPSIQIVGGGAS